MNYYRITIIILELCFNKLFVISLKTGITLVHVLNSCQRTIYYIPNVRVCVFARGQYNYTLSSDFLAAEFLNGNELTFFQQSATNKKIL